MAKENKITDRSSDMRKRAEELLLLWIDNVKDYAIFMLDPEGRVVTWNAGAERMKGYTAEEIIGKHFFLFYTAEDIAGNKPGKRLQTALESGQAEEEILRVRKDGSLFWANVITTAFRDYSGKLRGFTEISKDITESKQAEQEARNRQHFIQKILNTTPNLIYIYDLIEHRNVYANREVTEILGYTEEQLQSMGSKLFSSILHPDDMASVGRHHACFLTAGDSDVLDVTYRMKHSNGQWRWLKSCDIVFTRDNDGKPLQILGTAEDITERKQAEEAIMESEDKYRQAVNLSYDAVVMFDAGSGQVIEANKAAEALYGYSHGEFLRVTHMDMTADREASAASISRTIESGRDYVSLRIHRKKDGTPFPVEISSSSFMYKGSKVVCGCIRDISSRAKAEAILRASEEKFRRLFNNSEIGMLRTSFVKSELLDMNQKFLDIVGMKREEALSMPPDAFWADPNEREEMARRMRADGRVAKLECKILTKQGGVRNCLASATLYPEQGIVEGSIIDITEYKKLEEQLSQAQKMEAIGTLAGGVAHDFNNILTAIIGFGTMAKNRVKGDEKTRQFIEEILAGANRAAELTHSLLAFSRKQTIELKQVDLNDVVRQINKMLIRVIGEDIKLTNLLINRKLIVMIDRGQIEQVLLNLATNARDAMPDGGDLIIETGVFDVDSGYAEPHNFDNSGMYAVLTVSDKGIGMEGKTMENIFEPFFTTKEVGKGTGLGLSMVYGIVKQHEGSINVYSEPGKGTTFRIYLPMVTDLTEAEPAAARSVLLGSGETILLVEDDPQVRKVTGMYLQENGYRVVEAENGEEAVKMFLGNRDSIAIVLLDVIMPVKNGQDVYEEIKKLKPDIKAIFMSGYTDDIISSKGILEEEFDFISKPINPDTLIRKIRDLLDNELLPGPDSKTNSC